LFELEFMIERNLGWNDLNVRAFPFSRWILTIAWLNHTKFGKRGIEDV